MTLVALAPTRLEFRIAELPQHESQGIDKL